MLNPYKEANFLLKELKTRNTHVTIKEKYIVDTEENKTDQIIK